MEPPANTARFMFGLAGNVVLFCFLVGTSNWLWGWFCLKQKLEMACLYFQSQFAIDSIKLR